MSFASLREALTRSGSARGQRAETTPRGTLRGRRLRCESLESRTLLSVSQFSIDDLTVTEGDDTGAFVDVLLPDPDTAGALDGPCEFVVGPDGNVYVADVDEIHRYDMSTGDLIDVFVPSHTIGDPDFADSVGPFGLAFSPLDDNLYVASWDGNEVLRYQGPTGPTPGAFIDTFIPNGRIDKAANLLFDNAGTLYVSSIDSDEVLHYDASGSLIDVVVSAADGLDDPFDLVFDDNGGLLVASSATSQILRYDIATDTTSVFVSTGSGGLASPQGLEFAVDGDLYVASTGTDQVLRYDGSSGAFDGIFVPAKSAGLMWTGDLLFAPDGDLFVSSYAMKAILKFDGSTGAFLDYFTLSSRLTTPRGVEFGPDGSLYVSNWYGRSVKRYDGQSGTFIEQFVQPASGGMTGAAELHFGPDGNLYVSSGVSICCFDGNTGAFIDTFVPAGEGGLDHPREFIFHTDGMLYVSSTGSESVLRFDSGSGQFIDVFVAPQAGGLDAPTGMAFGPDGHLYVLDRGTGDVFRYDGTSGAFLDVFANGGGQLVREYTDSLVFGPDGNLYVNSAGENRVLRYDGATGEYIGDFVSPALGGLFEPYALAFDSNGSLYVADQGTTAGGHVMRYAPASHAAFRVTLSDPSATLVTVDYATSNGTGEAERDFTTVSGTLTFAPGETSKTIIVPTLDDLEIEENETFFVNLSNPTGGATIADGQGQATIIDVEAPLFSDSFENGQWDGKWVEDSQNDWFTSTQRETDGNYSAEVDGRATDATLTVNQTFNMEAFGSAEVTFDWYIESGFDSGEYLALDFSPDGSTWTEIKRLRGNVDPENTWHNETIDVDPAYLTDGFNMRFRAYVSGSREDANVDNVQLWATSLAVPPNYAPVAGDDAYSVTEDGSLSITAPGVLSDDTDDDSDALSAVLYTGPVDGSLTLNTDGSFDYTPNADFSGTDSFAYRAFDGADYSNVATVTITVEPVNDAPVAVGDGYSVDEDGSLAIPATGVLGNDTDADQDSLSAVLVDDVSNGTLVLNADGSFTYDPNANFNGTDSFTYKANDGTVDSSVVAVSITVNPVNDAPAAVDDGYSVDEDGTLVVVASGVLTNDTDTENDPLSVVLGTGPTNGLLTLNADGSFSYTPNANFHGTDSFTYRANDGADASNLATVTITVDPVNDAPTAVGDAYVGDQDTDLNVAAPGVLTGDDDIDGDSLSALPVTGPSNGVLNLNADGSFDYTPTPGFYGSDSFTYKANDGQEDSPAATVSLTVNRVNIAPMAVNDSYAMDEDTGLSIIASGVLANDTDVEDDPLSAVLVSGPTDGSLTLNADGSFTYDPDANFNGIDSFTYLTNDGIDDSNVATVTIMVNAVNDAPTVLADGYSVAEDGSLNVAAPGALDNDSDVDGDSLTATLVTGPASGGLTLNADGSFTYTPIANFHGSDGFTYEADDGQGGTAQAIVSLTVTSVNDPPVAVGDVATTDEDTGVVIAVLGNDTDIEGDTLMPALVGGPANGSLNFNPNGTITYMPGGNFYGTDSFTYVANDGADDSDVATVTITVNAVNDAPVAVDDTYNVDEDGTLVIPVVGVPDSGVLANDTDTENSSLTAVLGTGPANGILSLALDGSFTYTPNAGFSGTDSFTYQANDGDDHSNVATVDITVNAIATGPMLRNGVVTANTGDWATVNLDHTYDNMVVVLTPNYDKYDAPMVGRVRNASGDSFQVRLDRADGQAGSASDEFNVHYMVVEEGVYDIDIAGGDKVKMEAVKFTSTVTDENNSWVGESRTYEQTYTNPVVVGQVMTTNDAWSVFWACGSSRTAAPSAGYLKVGKNVAEDSDTTRADETIGYVVVETGTWNLDGKPFIAALGGDTIKGVGDAPAYSYGYAPLDSVTAAVASQAAMDGGNGGWAVLYGDNPVSTTSINLAIDEDTIKDTERRHTTEQVAYLVFDPPLEAAAAADQALSQGVDATSFYMGNFTSSNDKFSKEKKDKANDLALLLMME